MLDGVQDRLVQIVEGEHLLAEEQEGGGGSLEGKRVQRPDSNANPA